LQEQLFSRAGEITGQTFRPFDIMTRYIEEAGFTNVVEKVFKVPMGPWAEDPTARELGKFMLWGFDIGLEGFGLATLTRVMG
jgi:hypothetical protein